MNKLSTESRVRVVSCLVEGCSIRATVRMTGVSKNTVTKLLCDLGEVCLAWHDENAINLPCQRVQADEIWSFCYAKDKGLPDHMRDEPGVGSIWTWTAIDADHRFMVSWLCGNRDLPHAQAFMHDVAYRLADRVQLTTDGLHCYLKAVPDAFASDIDFATIQKIYGKDPDLRKTEVRYSPGTCIGVERKGRIGRPLGQHVSTSYVERHNLTMRMQMRRFTRLTNAFSKKFENLCAAVAIHMMHYNLCRKHKTLGTSPAVSIGLTDHVWSIDELVGLLDTKEQADIAAGKMKRGSYKKRADSK